jgi:hypothetical protein
VTAAALTRPITTRAPALADVLAVLEGAEPSTAAGIAAVRAAWPCNRDAAVAWIRAAVFAPQHRANAVAIRYRRRYRVTDRRLADPAPVPSRLAWDRDQGWHETDPPALADYVDRHFENTEPRR